MKKTYGKLFALAIQIAVLIGTLSEGVISEPESELDFYIAVIFLTFLLAGIGWVLYLIIEDIVRNQRRKRDE